MEQTTKQKEEGMERIVIKYPPDYDGELHIYWEPIAIPKGVRFTTMVAARPDEYTPHQVLRRIAQDILDKVPSGKSSQEETKGKVPLTNFESDLEEAKDYLKWWYDKQDDPTTSDMDLRNCIHRIFHAMIILRDELGYCEKKK